MQYLCLPFRLHSDPAQRGDPERITGLYPFPVSFCTVPVVLMCQDILLDSYAISSLPLRVPLAWWGRAWVFSKHGSALGVHQFARAWGGCVVVSCNKILVVPSPPAVAEKVGASK